MGMGFWVESGSGLSQADSESEADVQGAGEAWHLYLAIA